MSDSRLTSRDVRALVVPPQQEEILGVLDLVAQEEKDGLEALLSSVHVVAKEKVSCLSWITSYLEQFHQIEILTVNVTADCNWCIHLQQVGFLSENCRAGVDDP